MMESNEHELVTQTLPGVSDVPGALFFGGSFDPPHAGHVALPDAVLEFISDTIGIHSIIYVPAARSPHKDTSPTPRHHRVQMLGIAIRTQGNAQIWTGELDRASTNPGAPSYWYETWNCVRDVRAGADDRFLIGADQALSMHRWSNYERFWRDAIVVLRDQQDDPQSLIDSMQCLGVWSDTDLEHWRSLIVRVPMIDASSTNIRACLADPGRRENPIAGLDDRVHSYILNNGLYRP